MSNPLNEYASVNSVNPTYDADGNQLTGILAADPAEAAGYLWDAENRLLEAKADGTTVGEYRYDPFGRRIMKTVGTGGPTGPTSTVFVYDGWNLAAEYQPNSGNWTLKTSYLFGQDLSGSLQGAGGVSGLLSVTEHGPSSVERFHPTYDGNGNVSEYLGASGAVAAHFEYDPFGQVIVNTDPTNRFPIRFSTKYEDFETGLSYYGYRYYDPQQGRWLSRDPIKESGGFNLYAMVFNSPLGSVDKWGLATISVDSSCEGHEDLLSGMTYFSESEPPNNGPKVHRSLPAPGQQVAADALYPGDGTATKTPDGSSITISCHCENGVWKATQTRQGSLMPGKRGAFTEWPRGSTTTPDRWPGTGQDNIIPHSGNPPDGPLPPLNPEPIPAPPDGYFPFGY